MITVVAFYFETRRDESIPPERVSEALAAGAYCWVDIDCTPCAAATPDCGACRHLLDALGVNAQAASELLGPDRDGRYDVYEDCLHFAVTEARLEEGRLLTAHVDLVLGEHFLITYRRQAAEFPRRMRRTCHDDFHKFAKSPGFLLYEAGDHLIERYRDTLRGLASSVEQVQLRLFGETDDRMFRQVAALTQDILVFRKTVLATRELLHELATRRSPFISETTQPFLETMAGTLERLGADITTEREVLNEMLNLYMGMVSHRTNKVINRLTVISLIFLPLSFLCGVFGMNFVNMPELEWPFGYPMFWALSLGIAVSMVWSMRRRGWL